MADFGRPTLTARPAAKLNLTLEIGQRGADGYHPLRSVFLRIGLADLLSISPAPTGTADRLVVTGLPGSPVEGNIVLRALALLRERAGAALPPLDIELEKRIPVAAGLGGGSSDGAAALGLAQACWGIGLAPAEVIVLAARLGSDVPFFAAGAAVALVEGRGELITALPTPAAAGLLLATLPVELSTRDVFARHDSLTTGARAAANMTDELAAALESGKGSADLGRWAERLRDANDLWLAAADLERRLPALREELEGRTGRPWLLTGSGPTLFALYPSATEAAAAGAELAQSLRAAAQGATLQATDLIGPDPTWRHS